MFNKHFFKFLLAFVGMIIVGVLGLFLIDAYVKDSPSGGSALSIPL